MPICYHVFAFIHAILVCVRYCLFVCLYFIFLSIAEHYDKHTSSMFQMLRYIPIANMIRSHCTCAQNTHVHIVNACECNSKEGEYSVVVWPLLLLPRRKTIEIGYLTVWQAKTNETFNVRLKIVYKNLCYWKRAHFWPSRNACK